MCAEIRTRDKKRTDAESVACLDYQSAAVDGKGEKKRYWELWFHVEGKALKWVTSCIDGRVFQGLNLNLVLIHSSPDSCDIPPALVSSF